ncbi:MAG: peptidyl-tRNA hydrolase Pth2 [Sulfolobales archaeon]
MKNEEFKQVIVVRVDLMMSVGKLAAQVAHASVDAVLKSFEKRKEWLDRWIESGMKKVVVKVSSESELTEIYRKCEALEIPCSIIRDAGRTEIEPGTLTAVGVGPAPSRIVDKVTGGLPLL